MDTERAWQLVLLLESFDRDDDAEDAYDLLVAATDELMPATDTLIAAGEVDGALRLVGSLSYFAQDCGWVQQGRALAADVVERVGDLGDSLSTGRALLTVGELAFRQGDQAEALAATRAALDRAREDGDDRLEFRAEFNLARVAFRDADAPSIFEHANRMLELAGDDPRRRFGAVHMLAWGHHTAGDVERAVALIEENVETARAAGHRTGEVSELLNLASLALQTGGLDMAAVRLRGALDTAEELESSYLLPGVLTEVGRLCVLHGRPEPGLQLIAAGEHQYEVAGMTPDPGDDEFEQQRTAAIAELGPVRSAKLIELGRSLTSAEAIGLAREHLANTVELT